MIHTLFTTDEIKYDGSQLSSLWALRRFGLQGDSIVSFIGPCEVNLDGLVDIRDYLDNAPIFSPRMLNFIVEHFSSDLEAMVLRQRLLVAIIKDTVAARSPAVLQRKGDDIYSDGRKLSVSIATASPVSTMIHTGLNVTTEGVPVPAIGLSDLNWPEMDLPLLAKDICSAYAEEIEGIRMARCKVRGVR